jgi:integrase
MRTYHCLLQRTAHDMRAYGHISRNWFRIQVWKPALTRAGLDFNVRMHDLRHAHASWLQMSRVAADASFDRSRNRLPAWGLGFRLAVAVV